MNSLAPTTPTVTDFEARIADVDDRTVSLEETYFYPEGGGQPADRGTIDGIDVVDVQSVDGQVRHVLESEPPTSAGETVECVIDDEFRTYLMRAHTASHALYGAGRQILDDLGYGGFDMTEEKVRIDFETTTTIDDSTLVDLERLVNQVVWESREVTWKRLPRKEALSREDVAFNTKTEEGLSADSVRIVEIDGWDVAACGGTHVDNTESIGPVTVLDRSNPGEGQTRVEFAVGPQAIARRARESEAARLAARRLDSQVEELPAAVERVCENRDSLAAQVDELRTEVLEARLTELRGKSVSRDGVEWIAGTVPSNDANELGEFARELVDRTGGVVALVGESGEYLGVATGGEIAAAAVVSDVTDEFGGGGGGGKAIAQAGGLDAPAEEVVAFLRGK